MLKFALKKKEIGFLRCLKYYLKDLLHCKFQIMGEVPKKQFSPEEKNAMIETSYLVINYELRSSNISIVVLLDL